MKRFLWSLLMIGVGMGLQYGLMHRPPQCELNPDDGSCVCTVSEQVWLNSIHPEIKILPSLQSQ
jgi:hypothetical protein